MGSNRFLRKMRLDASTRSRERLDRAGRRMVQSRMDETKKPSGKKKLSPAAERALAEAEARRADIDARVRAMPEERSGRKGPEPVRYGDWEVKGLTSDF